MRTAHLHNNGDASAALRHAAVSEQSPLSLQIGIGCAQLLLGTLFGLSGVLKTFMAPGALVAIGVSWASDAPLWLLRLSGAADSAAAAAILLPALTRTLPFMLPLAALGLAADQLVAIGFHVLRGELAITGEADLLLLGLSLFLLWGGLKTQAAAFKTIDRVR